MEKVTESDTLPSKVQQPLSETHWSPCKCTGRGPPSAPGIWASSTLCRMKTGHRHLDKGPSSLWPIPRTRIHHP